MRSELRGALPEGVRVVRESATYLLCALEYGESSHSALERREAAFGRVAALEERVRLHLSAIVREHAAGLGAAAGALGELDVSHRRRALCAVASVHRSGRDRTNRR